ncbi:MAG TPA: hypothetical protein VHS56_08925 [Candidatus Cybelea sp.]|jgi:hypothetical protein|nr:hypothetical protein [Candidatus Cybelea sp.]
MPMDARLEQVLDAFTAAHGRYALARLEFALHHPAKPAPPVVAALCESCEGELRTRFPEIEMQLETALAFAGRHERGRRRRRRPDPQFRLYSQSLRELDRSARALRWMLTITESRYDL